MLYTRGTKSEKTHMWADGLHHPCLLGGPQCLKPWDKIRNGPQVGTLAASPMPSTGTQRFKVRRNQRKPTDGQVGYINPAIWDAI